ncbi:hypothetical protein [Parafilimonas terrae]|uniref:Uncharacterized protein n=1 Tax=Parafilimonas terrae TaxID=1465490 RepID=A0A1I5S759_9BACT|nr:hypothetical protein [Parafilimonas terrae]SFP66530.1 hypothetical protein SAMN05444277_101618 [Parafilimonas terrae]
MEKYQIIEAIILMPKRFKDGVLSMFSLLKESGYFKYYKEITENDISEILTNHSENVDCWLAWSQDKRTGPGWYFEKKQNGESYTVAHYPPKTNFDTIISLNAIEACAAFIKREIEDIRRS